MRHLTVVDPEDLRKLCYLALMCKKHVKAPSDDNYFANALRTSGKLVQRVCKKANLEIDESKGKLRVKSKDSEPDVP